MPGARGRTAVMGRSKEVDGWFARYENPMKDVVQRIRAIILGADTRMGECIKWQAPTFTYLGNLASFYPKSKQHASLMFHTGAKIPGKHKLLEGTGSMSRVMKLGTVSAADAAKADIQKIVRAWCDWRDSEETSPSTSQSRASSRPVKVAAKSKTSRARAT